MPAYSLVRVCMLDYKGVGWHHAPGWFHLKCIIKLFWRKDLESLLSLCCCLFSLASFRIIYYIDKYFLKGFWYPPLHSDWYPMLLFEWIESSLLSAFWNVLSYSVIRAYSVFDFDKCTTLFRYFSLLCYLELRSNLNVPHLVLQLSLPNPMKPGIKSRMKM